MENSECSSSCCDSVCCACELIPPALLQAIPEEYKRIKFEELKDEEDYTQNFVVGKVFQTFPISKRANGFFRKLLLNEAVEKQEEEKSEKKLNMFILNENEQQLESIDQKSFVAVSGFKAEKLTLLTEDENMLPIQVLVIIHCNSNDSTMMWIARSVAPALDDSTCSQTQGSDGESMECDDPPRPLSPDEEDFQALVKEYSQREQVFSSDESDVSIESDESTLQPEKTGESESSKSKSPSESTDHQSDVEEQANPVPESSGRQYTYMKLNELKESVTPDQYFNIYGIVVNCYFKPSAPDKDRILELILRDSTMDYFRCRVIGRCTDKFPDVYPGDIVRIHRMLVDKFRDKFKGKCFSPKFIIVFDGKTDNYKPRCVARTFVFIQDDKKMVQSLRILGRQKQTVKLIAEIEMDDFVTLLCQVVTVYVVRDDTVLLKVWDGTTSYILNSDKSKNLMRGKVDERLFNIAKNYLVPVWINGDYTIAAAELKPGQYVKICDVHLYASKSKPDEPRLCIHPQTKIGRGVVVLDTKDDLVQELKSRLQKIWEEAGVAEEISMDDTPSFMKDVAMSRFDEPGTSGENVPSQEDIDASQSRKAALLASQQLLISSLNQGIEPASSMQLTASTLPPAPLSRVPAPLSPVPAPLSPEPAPLSPEPAPLSPEPAPLSPEPAPLSPEPALLPPSNDQLSPPQESVGSRTVDEGLVTPSSDGKSPAAKEGVKRSNTDSDVDNANKKQKVDNHDAVVVPPASQSKDAPPNASGSDNAPPPAPSHSQPALNTSRLVGESSPLPNSSIPSQPDWWKSLKPVSASIGHQHIQPTFLNNVVKHFVPYKFRVYVTVLNIEPQLDTMRKLVRVYCPKCHYLSDMANPDLEVFETRDEVPLYLCPECLTAKNSAEDDCQNQLLEYTFLACFTLHDGTSTIDAYMWKENAVKFFKGIRPEDTLIDSSQSTLVRQMLWDICPNCCPFQSTNGTSLASNNSGSYYPVLDCCIMSYTCGGKTRYQIFDTRLN